MQSKYINVNQNKIHYLEKGKGKVIILLSSFGLSSRASEPFGDMLSKNYRIIIPDLFRGKSNYKTIAKSFNVYAEALNSFVNKLNIKKFYLIGPSFGGIVAQYYLFKFPKKIKKLLLVSIIVTPIKFNYFKFFYSYAKLTINNVFLKNGLKYVILWYSESFSYLIKNPKQIINDLNMSIRPIKTKKLSIKIPTKLLFAKKDEFIPFKTVFKMKKIKNLQVDIINGHHAWYFLNKRKFIDIVEDFFK